MKYPYIHILLAACTKASERPEASSTQGLVLSAEYPLEVSNTPTHLNLDRRSNLPILDEIFKVLADTGLANAVIDFALLNPELLNISANAVIFALRSGYVNLTNVLIALQKSGLILQTLELGLADPEVLPGLLRLTKALLAQQDENTNHKRFSEITEDVDIFERADNGSEILNEIFLALKDSGLAISVVQHLITDPSLAVPGASFLTKVIQSHAVTIPQLLQALKQSNLILELLRDILNDPSILQRFEDIIANRIAKGLIPKSVYDGA